MPDILNNALDIGIKEAEFWEMTMGEIERAVDSFRRTHQAQLKQRASMDYTLAGIIGLYVAQSFGGSGGVEIPTLEQCYPSLFEEEVKEKEQKIEENKMILSEIRLRQFSQQHNQKIKEVEREECPKN